jgi:hypothetical protein
LFLIAILIPAIWFLFLNKSTDYEKATEILTGVWIRSDGSKAIEIKAVGQDGKLEVAYLNPNPIHVGQAEWRIKEEYLQIFVELQDKNYPGSLYQLTFDKEKKLLYGTYYQAVDEVTFEVFFTKK